MSNRHFYLTDDGSPIMVKAHFRPSAKKKPKRGTWCVYEYDHKIRGWVLACFPEITWGTLRKFTYIGKIKPTEQGE